MPAGVLGQRLRRDRFFQLGVALVALVMAAALLAPWLAPFDPLTGDLRNAYLLGPGGRFALGRDSLGRDVVDAVVMRLADVTLAFPTLLLAQALGARDRRVLLRHLLPNVRTAVILAATLGLAGSIMAKSALSLVGLGAQPPTPSWGAMVADGRDRLRVAPWVSFAPGMAIGLAVLGFNLVGDGSGEALDPQLHHDG